MTPPEECTAKTVEGWPCKMPQKFGDRCHFHVDPDPTEGLSIVDRLKRYKYDSDFGRDATEAADHIEALTIAEETNGRLLETVIKKNDELHAEIARLGGETI